ncbi:radical SAM protein [Candidatus Bathyarchaeota archaeon]|nr:radical SAM protein [Candidatus Bathyarchaeota archaeon]
MTDILLVQPPLPKPIGEYTSSIILCPPLGLGYIASKLILDGFKVEIIDMAALDLSLNRLKREVEQREPKIVGITAETLTYKNALKAAKLVKEVDSRILTVLGGPHVTFLAEKALTNSQVDVVVRREGEITMSEVARRFLRGNGNLENIEGITYRKDGHIISNPERPLIEDLDSLPFPARELFPLDRYRVPGTLITSRGCPSKCIFCSAGAMYGGRYRVRSPESVASEVHHMIEKFNFDKFFIADDTFTVFRDRTRKICRSISDLNVQWFCESRVNTVNKEILKEMAESGCRVIQYGVESGSQKILNSIRKGITVEQVRKAVKWSVEVGIIPVCSFMVPHPEDTLETIEETRKFMEELKSLGALVVISLTTPFPGTYLYDHAKELGLKFILEDTDRYDMATPVFTTKNLTLEQIEKAFDDLISLCMTQESFQLLSREL